MKSIPDPVFDRAEQGRIAIKAAHEVCDIAQRPVVDAVCWASENGGQPIVKRFFERLEETLCRVGLVAYGRGQDQTTYI